MPRTLIAAAVLSTLTLSPPSARAAEGIPAEEVRAFMQGLASYVDAHHLKKDPRSPQAGMVYEYVDTTRLGQPGQWIQGEALDTMHDGAWYAAALVDAFRATGDARYREFLVEHQVPFYTNVLNHSDTLFRDGLDPKKVAPSKHEFAKSHRYMGEKGFCPYFWDDGASWSLEADWKKTGRHPYQCVDYDPLAGRPNPQLRLNGFSLGCSNHMAQDLAVMLLKTWQLTGDARIAEAAMNLHRSRLLHHGPIPAVVAAAACCNHDDELRKKLPAPRPFEPRNDYAVALYAYQKGQPRTMPGFADNQEYVYYSSLVKEGGLSRAAAVGLIYDAFTLPMLVRYWSDVRDVPPGMNRSEGANIRFVDGKPESYRSDRDLSMGSRMGPQNLVVSACALQALRAYPGIWEERYRKEFGKDLLVRFLDTPPALDGRADDGYSRPIEAGGLVLRLAADRRNLYLAGGSQGGTAAITVFSGPDAAGRRAVLEIDKTAVRAVNGDGAKLVERAKVTARGDGFDFEVRLPFTVVKGQEPWATGIEHGRYSVRIGGATRNLYLMSTEEQVKRALERELVEGLKTWRRVLREKGFIPIALGKANIWTLGGTRVNKISDSGGYAHLLEASAQYLLYQQGKCDWAK